ncbi:hypothetical protein D3C86_1592520 [compost metagenome]
MAGGGHVRNLCRVKGGEVGGGANLSGEVQVRRVAHALDRDQVGQAGVGVDMAAHDVEKVDHAAVFQAPGNVQAIGRGQPAGHLLVAGITHADNELMADSLANGAEDVEGKAQPIVDGAAIGGLEVVGQRRPELVHQMPVGLQFDAVQAGKLHALGGIGIVFDDAFHIPVFHLLREGAVGGLALE